MYTYIYRHISIYIHTQVYMQASTHIHTYICNGQTIAPRPNLLLPKWHTSRPATFHKNEGELQQPCAHLPNVRPSSLVPWQPTAPKMPGTRMRLNFMDVVAPRSSTGWSRYRINYRHLYTEKYTTLTTCPDKLQVHKPIKHVCLSLRWLRCVFMHMNLTPCPLCL